MSVIGLVSCDTYDLDSVRRAVMAALAPLGGIGHFVRPGMRVLLKPNLLSAAGPERAVTTHPAVVEAVAELVQQSGAVALIGDSPPGPVEREPAVWPGAGMTGVVARTGARLVLFEGVTWKRLNGHDYFVARPVSDADLVINLPKLKTHNLTLYTGAVKNLLGVIPGTRKREVHLRAPGARDFSRALVDVLELVRPGLTILDGVVGQEGSGPGAGGTPRRYGCLAASEDPVALDATMAGAMGYGPGEILHLVEADARGLGQADPGAIRLEGEREVLEFGPVVLPATRALVRYIPSWLGAPLHRAVRVRPRLIESACLGCGECADACPLEAITPGPRPRFDLERCVGCLCCSEVCPEGAVEAQRNFLARLVGISG